VADVSRCALCRTKTDDLFGEPKICAMCKEEQDVLAKLEENVADVARMFRTARERRKIAAG
jgi:hypothetical protein